MNFSVITVCKNAEWHIERAIKSVICQTHPNFQYIIIDGKSTDSTLDIIKKYRYKIDTIISEKDSGIYNAMNKALKIVTGEVVCFLNSDDCFYDNKILADLDNEFKKNSKAEIIYGNVVITLNGKQKVLKYNGINKRFFYKNTICHQALFIEKNLYDLIGDFDESYPIHADVDWLMKAYFKHKANFHYFDRIICHYSSEGFSSNPIFAEKHKYDRQKISAKYFLEAKIKLFMKQYLMRLGLYS
jgi:glycosyltransferase involved in cell wall biosynthesis